MLTPFKDPIIKHHVEQYLNKSLRIACKALSLDTPPTIPLLGLIGVFRWVHLATTDISITVDYVQATLTTFGYVLTLFYIYLCLFIWLTPKNASESFSGRFLTYGNCLTHDITLDYWLRTITRSAFPHAIFLHHGATRDRTPNRYPLCWRLTISSPRLCFCCLWSIQQGPSRAVLLSM